MAERHKVLIVEDNADLRRLYAIGLNQHGFEVRLAANGAEALDRIETEKPDLILLDLLMPVMDGWELIDKVNPANSAVLVPVIVLTGQSLPSDRSLHPCVVGWLSKPAEMQAVVELIHRHLLNGSPSSFLPPSGNPGPNRLSSASG